MTSSRYHRPRVIAISGLVVALGSFLSALPQFLSDNLNPSEVALSRSNYSDMTETAIELGKGRQ